MLRLLKDWEPVFDKQGFEIEEVKFNNQRQVTRVRGYVNTSDRRLKVHWDGFGRCYVNGNRRITKYDVVIGE